MFDVSPDPVTLAVEPAPTDPSPDDRSARALIEEQLVMLTRLAEIGMAIAEAAGRAAAQQDAGGGDQPDPALTYARAARAVRLTIALQSRLLTGLAALDRAESLAEISRATMRRNRIHHLVGRVIAAGCDDANEIERLSSNAWERLTDEDDFGALIDLPLDEAVARICEDLGLSPDASAQALAVFGGAAGTPLEAREGVCGADPLDPGPAGAASVRPAAQPRASPVPATAA